MLIDSKKLEVYLEEAAEYFANKKGNIYDPSFQFDIGTRYGINMAILLVRKFAYIREKKAKDSQTSAELKGEVKTND